MTGPAEEGTLFELPSYQEWLNRQNETLDEQEFPPVATRRAWHIAGETPYKFFAAIAYRAAYTGTRDYLRRQGRKAISGGDGEGSAYLPPTQITLPDLQGFLIANYDRRLADAKSERRFVVDWCEAHEGYTAKQVYALAGVPMPTVKPRAGS